MNLQRYGSNLYANLVQIPYLPNLHEFAPKQIYKFATKLQPLEKIDERDGL